MPRIIITLALCSFWVSSLTAQQLLEPAQYQALSRFQQQHQHQVKVRWHRAAPIPATLYGFRSEPYTHLATPEQIARQFILDNHALFQTKVDSFDLVLWRNIEQGGVHHVTFQQYYEGYPVLGAIYQVAIGSDKTVHMMGGLYYPNISISSYISLMAADALRQAMTSFKLSASNIYSSSVQRVVVPKEEHFYWGYSITLNEHGILINAQTREIEAQGKASLQGTFVDDDKESNAFRLASPGPVQETSSYVSIQGLVYELDPFQSPLDTVWLPRLHGSGNQLDGQYARVTNKELNVNEESVSWSTNQDYIYPPQPSSSCLGFTYWNGHDCSHFDDVNAYYHIDKFAHDFWFMNLSFELPYQTFIKTHAGNNGGGTARYDKRDITLDHERQPDTGSFLHDPAKASDVLYHEYTHLITGYAGLWAISSHGAVDETRELSEGYSDYFSATFTGDAAFGEGWLDCPAGFASGTYCSGHELDKNEIRTLATTKTTWNYLQRGTVEYNFCSTPQDGFTSCNEAWMTPEGTVHANGVIWGSALWDLRQALGPGTTDLLAFKGLLYTPGTNVYFEDALSGLLIADYTLYNGDHEQTILQVMADRGINNVGTSDRTIWVYDSTDVSSYVTDTLFGQDLIIMPDTTSFLSSNKTLILQQIFQDTSFPLDGIPDDSVRSTIYVFGNSTQKGTLDIQANATIVCDSNSEIIIDGGLFTQDDSANISMDCMNACTLTRNGGEYHYRSGSYQSFSNGSFLANEIGTYFLEDNVTVELTSTADKLHVIPGSAFELGTGATMRVEIDPSRIQNLVGTVSEPITFTGGELVFDGAKADLAHVTFTGTALSLENGADVTIYADGANVVLPLAFSAALGTSFKVDVGTAPPPSRIDVVSQPIARSQPVGSARGSISEHIVSEIEARPTPRTEVENEAEAISSLPTTFSLSASYPNPFNPLTVVPFAVPNEARVHIAVYNVLGKQVALLADASFAAGHYQVHFDGSSLPSGVYLIHAAMAAPTGETARFAQTVTLVK